jgi:hypothetical protein
MEIVRKAVISYLPGVKVLETQDYIPDLYLRKSPKAKILNLAQLKSFHFPLRQQRVLKEHDPIAYLTGNMTKLRDDELVSMQLVVRPANRRIRNSASKAENYLLRGGDSYSLANQRFVIPLLILKMIIFGILSLFTIPLGFVIFVLSGGKHETLFPHKYLLFPNKEISPQRTAGQEELSQEVLGKVREPLFEVSFRALFLNETSGLQLEREKGFLSSLSLFTNSTRQSFKKASIPNTPVLLIQQLFKNLPPTLLITRSPLFSPKLVLSSSELSDVYHFPYSTTTETEDLVKSRSKDLPAPLSSKNGTSNLDLVFGINSYGGQETPIGLTKEERRYHTYIIGATGTGKSTMLSTMISEDIKNGKGLAVIDPHGDLINGILSEITEERLDDVVFLNPDDEGYPIGLNIMEVSKSGILSESREKDFIVSSLVSLFQKLYPPNSWGTRMEYILRNAALTTLELKDPTIFTIQRLLTEKDFRDQATAILKPGLLKKFWDHEFKIAGEYQKVQMISPITNKVGRFFGSGITRNMIGQAHSTIDFEDILNNGKILLCDLSQGKIGEDNSELLGILTIAKIQLAALKRARINVEDRKDFYLYVDEFQNFATPSFAKILSEARKYRLNAVLAHQTTAQIEDKDLLKVILANSGTVVSFRTAGPSDESLILPILSPNVEENAIANLPNYHFYTKTPTSNSSGAFSGVSIKFNPENNEKNKLAAISRSRILYARSKDEVELEIEKSFLSQSAIMTSPVPKRLKKRSRPLKHWNPLGIE